MIPTNICTACGHHKHSHAPKMQPDDRACLFGTCACEDYAPKRRGPPMGNRNQLRKERREQKLTSWKVFT